MWILKIIKYTVAADQKAEAQQLFQEFTPVVALLFFRWSSEDLSPLTAAFT